MTENNTPDVGRIVHANDTYTVQVSTANVKDEKVFGYDVVNNATGVIEFSTYSLPEAIQQAEHSHVFLSKKMWTWIAGNAKALDETTDESEAPKLTVN